MLKTIVFFILICQTLYGQSIIIGKTDKIDLPSLNLENIRVKIDTGAKTSSLHCSYIEEVNEKNVRFKVLDNSYKQYKDKLYEMPIHRITQVKSSNGEIEKRYVILTEVIAFNKRFPTEFTLTNRKKMNYPLLLGEKFLKQGFIVDVRQENLSYHQK